MVSTKPITAETKALVENILCTDFGCKVEDISLEAKSNNSNVYTLAISHEVPVEAAASGSHSQARLPGTDPLPVDAIQVVIRFTDAGDCLNGAVQVQNEVAALVLMRNAFSSLDAPVAPRVYGWRPVDIKAGSPGWILEEHMPGVPLDDDIFRELHSAAKQSIVSDIATIFRLIQQYELPASVVGYGGLDFADDGKIITGPTAIHGATKACTTYYELYNEFLQTQLKFMDKCDVVQGWRDTDLRVRIDDFVARGFQPLLEKATGPHPRQTLVHGDFDFHNLLYDPQTNRITALLDFSFSHVASVNDEYFYSLVSLYQLTTCTDPTNPHQVIRKWLLHGYDSLSDKDLEFAPMINWDVAKLADATFHTAGVQRPIDLMPGIDMLADLYWFTQNISPGLFFMPRVRAKMGKEKQAVAKKSNQAGVEQVLKRWKF